MAPTNSSIWKTESTWRDLYPFESHWLDCPGGRLHYVHEGQDHGKHGTVVCVHGNPTWSFMWRDLIRKLSSSFQVIAPDHLGCGLSDMPKYPTYQYTLDERVGDLRSLLSKLVPDGPIHLVVHDWGGMIGTSWALDNDVRDRICSITAMNTACFLLPEGKSFPWMLRILKSLPGLAKLATLGGNLFAATAARTCTVEPLDPVVQSGYLYPYRSWNRRLATHWFVQDIPERAGDRAYSRALLTDKEAPSAFAHIPVFLPWGLQDYVFDEDFLREWQRRFPHARSLPLTQGGHYVLEDGKDRLMDAIAQHIHGAANSRLPESQRP